MGVRGENVKMILFQQKVAELKRVESTVYTICLSLADNEQAACLTAERVLTALFLDSEYWGLDELKRKPHILKLCVRIATERTCSQKEPVPSAI